MNDENPYSEMIQSIYDDIDKKTSSLRVLVDFMVSYHQQISGFLLKKTMTTQKLQNEATQNPNLALFSDGFTVFQHFDENYLNQFLTDFHENSINPLLNLLKDAEALNTQAHDNINAITKEMDQREKEYSESYQQYIDYCKEREKAVPLEIDTEYESKCRMLCKQLATTRKKYCLVVEQIFEKYTQFNDLYFKIVAKSNESMITLIDKLKNDYTNIKNYKKDNSDALNSRLKMISSDNDITEAISLDNSVDFDNFDIFLYSNYQYIFKSIMNTTIVVATKDCIDKDSDLVISKKGEAMFYTKNGKPYNAENIITRLKGNVDTSSFKQTTYKKHIVRLNTDFTDDSNRYYNEGSYLCALYEVGDKTICMNDCNTTLLINTCNLEPVK